MLPQSSATVGSDADERSTLLPTRRSSSDGVEMEPTLDTIEAGYGASEKCSGYATSDTSSSLTNDPESSSKVGEADEESPSDEERIARRHTWLLPFFANIFLACASFSIVMPSLAPYILDIGAPLAFLPWVVSSYSVGEMFGSVAIGHFYEYSAKTFETPGRGPRVSMMLCILLGVVGSAMYAVAGWIDDVVVAKYCLLLARLVQGVWTGGQQAIEQGVYE